jgi:hypothetical protein
MSEQELSEMGEETVSEQDDDVSEEEITKTAVRRQRISARDTRRKLSPVNIFTDGLIASKIWFGLALVATGIALIEPIMIVSAMKKEERVIALDALGTIYVSPLKDFGSASELHSSQIQLATSALLDRNPEGPDNENLLKAMYLTDSYEQAKNQIKAESEEFKIKELHQKAEITGIEVIGTRENAILGRAVGQLIRAGVFNGQSFSESIHFDLNLTLVRNPDLRQNGRFPTAVYAFKFNTTPNN